METLKLELYKLQINRNYDMCSLFKVNYPSFLTNVSNAHEMKEANIDLDCTAALILLSTLTHSFFNNEFSMRLYNSLHKLLSFYFLLLSI